MKIIYGKAGKGRVNQLLKMFMEDSKSATFLTDSLTMDNIIEKMICLKENDVDIMDFQGKEIKTNMYTNCDSDYYYMIQDLTSQSMYLDLCISSSFKEQFKSFCIDIENEYGINIVLAEQLPIDSDIDDIKIVEYTKQ